MNIKNLNNILPIAKLKSFCRLNKSSALKQSTKDSFESSSVTKRFKLNHNEYSNRFFSVVDVEQNLMDRAVIYKKIYNPDKKCMEKIPYEVGIAKSVQGWNTTYHLIEDTSNREIGYITICDLTKVPKNEFSYFLLTDSALTHDYPMYGISGDRISIDYIQNNFELEFAGIAKITDQLALEYCLKNNIKPQILSISEPSSHIAHYKRGRRFFIPDKDSKKDKFLRKFGSLNPNTVLEERLAASDGKKVKCSDLGKLYMYMPEAVIQKYLCQIKEHPILH